MVRVGRGRELRAIVNGGELWLVCGWKSAIVVVVEVKEVLANVWTVSSLHLEALARGNGGGTTMNLMDSRRFLRNLGRWAKPPSYGYDDFRECEK